MPGGQNHFTALATATRHQEEAQGAAGGRQSREQPTDKKRGAVVLELLPYAVPHPGHSKATTVSHGDNAPRATPAAPRPASTDRSSMLTSTTFGNRTTARFSATTPRLAAAFGRRCRRRRRASMAARSNLPRAARQSGRRLLLAVARALPANPRPLLLHRRFGARPPGGGGARGGRRCHTGGARGRRGAVVVSLGVFPTGPPRKKPLHLRSALEGNKIAPSHRYFSGK